MYMRIELSLDSRAQLRKVPFQLRQALESSMQALGQQILRIVTDEAPDIPYDTGAMANSGSVFFDNLLLSTSQGSRPIQPSKYGGGRVRHVVPATSPPGVRDDIVIVWNSSTEKGFDYAPLTDNGWFEEKISYNEEQICYLLEVYLMRRMKAYGLA